MKYIIAILMLIWITLLNVQASPHFGPYAAELVRVIDGDTVVLDVAIWPQQTERAHVRLEGIDTPELHSKQQCERDMALRAKAFTTAALTGSHVLMLDHVADGKYAGRVLGEIIIDGHSLSQSIIGAHMGRVYNGGARGPWCSDSSP